MELNFRGGRKPEIRAFQLEEVGGKFRQLTRAHERRCVYKKWRKNFRVSVLARVDIEEKIREGALEACSPAFVNRETGAGDFGRSLKIQNSSAFADFPVRPGLKIKFRRRAPTANFDIFCRTLPNRHAGVRQIRNPEQKVFLSLCQFDGLQALDLDRLREGLHLSDERIRIQVFFLEPPNLVAGFVPLLSERLRLCNQLSAFLIQRSESVQVESDTTLF